MRFNNRFCALMDIPDLPSGAFEHIGDGKIKPQGGGNPISAVTDPISSAIGTDGGGGGILGGLADIDPGPAIGSALADVDEFVNEEIPGGWVTPALIAAAAATGYVDPSLLGGEAAFAGASETGLATLAGEGAAASAAQVAAEAAGATLLSEAAAATQALPYTLAADAANLAANGFDAATIAQNLTATGVDSFVAADIANLAAQGLSESAIAQNIAQGYTAAELTGTGITSTLPTAGFSISPQQALQGIRAASGLLGGGQQQQQPQMLQMGGRNIKPAGAVDYSGLYNLLALQRAPNPNSLLG
jgi:hypothetical protein